ncbi:MAG: aa3-type cytochrome c oxidase subunit IV [Pseudomonadota bacterium]|jgi:hypothetical protein|nr:hypothetical protein [Alphaproteobacteria bacterium]MCS5597729.1 aa3-type cytochrome c oxidase subunit IV [Alphaproteobacteria bacterium]MEC7703303.1 aa3-type cytochrome c oxidase subunit IV [Pseudomonadota bacterium]MEC9235872.1 aa3-type cytochrome c oxidase subunit IV [Pseudomonadota bacterium]|tara:strand:- start:4171 stop:4320 length:150 start_codon:yes stop_codon:yes gene_type:complete
MASTKKVSVDKETVDAAQKTWESFVQFSKISTIFVIVVLVLMAAFLIKW